MQQAKEYFVVVAVTYYGIRVMQSVIDFMHDHSEPIVLRSGQEILDQRVRPIPPGAAEHKKIIEEVGPSPKGEGQLFVPMAPVQFLGDKDLSILKDDFDMIDPVVGEVYNNWLEKNSVDNK